MVFVYAMLCTMVFHLNAAEKLQTAEIKMFRWTALMLYFTIFIFIFPTFLLHFFFLFREDLSY